MPRIDVDTLEPVTATMNYLADPASRPAYYLYETRPGFTPPPPQMEKCEVPVYDVRGQMDTLTLDDNGFRFVRAPLPAVDFLDGAAVARDYYPLCADLVREHTGAARVHVFDHNVRDKQLATEDDGIRDPVRFVHNDYTDDSGPQRIRDLMGAEADDLLTRRFMFINVWRPLRGPVLDVPFGFCDAQSLDKQDFVATDLKYRDRTGEIYSVRHSKRHRWYYVRNMQSDEVMLLKCFDSLDDGRARYTAHSAFRDPAAPDDALPRRSIEVRSIAFFD